MSEYYEMEISRLKAELGVLADQLAAVISELEQLRKALADGDAEIDALVKSSPDSCGLVEMAEQYNKMLDLARRLAAANKELRGQLHESVAESELLTQQIIADTAMLLKFRAALAQSPMEERKGERRVLHDVCKRGKRTQPDPDRRQRSGTKADRKDQQ